MKATLSILLASLLATQNVSLPSLLERSYLDLFDQAPELSLSKSQLEEYSKKLRDEKKAEKERLDKRKHELEHQIDQAQEQLKDLNRTAPRGIQTEDRRKEIHCRIQSLRKELEQTKVTLDRGLDLKYDNQEAKLKVLQEWPTQLEELRKSIQSGQIQDRKFADFRDVGFRKGPFEGQEEDIEKGQEAVQEMSRLGLLPPEVDDKEVVRYINELAQTIAKNSDLRVPLQVTVLKSEEINAFALPGGFLFVNTGLILKAGKESELAGVLAHEIAHSAARHSHRLMAKANIANIVFQAAQIAALIFTGGVASLAGYYALQYGFYGLGLVLDLSLLGVSRDYELEADILGAQYLFHSNYNTRGFVSFFDRMASEKGYVTGLSWFRTHPPFYERMAETYEEITLLPPQEDPIDDSSKFHDMQAKLRASLKEMEELDREAPTLRRVIRDCP